MSRCRFIKLANGKKVCFPRKCQTQTKRAVGATVARTGAGWVDVGSVDDREPRQLPVDNSLFLPQLLGSERRENISSMLSFQNTAKSLCVPAGRPTAEAHSWVPLSPSAFVCFDGKSGESCRPELLPAASVQPPFS